MTEPAVLALELQSYLFDSSHLRDYWPRLQFAYIGSEAAVTTAGSFSGTSDHTCIYWVMPTVRAFDTFSDPIHTPKQAKYGNYAYRSCWNGRSSLPDRTLHQRRDDAWCGAIISSGKLLEIRSLAKKCLSMHDEDRQL